MNKEEYKEYYSSVYRHSLAHVLAKAVMEIFGKENVQIAIGPQIADGFYYDFLLPRNLVNEDFKTIEDKMREILKRREDFTVEEVSKEEALSIFKGQKFKEELIRDLPEDERITVISITEEGNRLKEQCKDIPMNIAGTDSHLSDDDAGELYRILYQILRE